LHRARFFIFLISIPGSAISICHWHTGRGQRQEEVNGGGETGGGEMGRVAVAYPADVWSVCWYMAVTWAKMRGRLNYIELRVVTQRTYERAGWVPVKGGGRMGSVRVDGSAGGCGIYSTTFWLRLILKNRHRQKLRAYPRAYVLARARWPYLFAPRVLRFVSRLSSIPFFLSLVLALTLALSRFQIRLPLAFPKKYMVAGSTAI